MYILIQNWLSLQPGFIFERVLVANNEPNKLGLPIVEIL